MITFFCHGSRDKLFVNFHMEEPNKMRLFVFPVASHSHHAGDGWLPSQASGRRERALHAAADARLPGDEELMSCHVTS